MVKLLLEKRCMNYDNDGCFGLPRLLGCAVPYDTNVVLGDVKTCDVMKWYSAPCLFRFEC